MFFVIVYFSLRMNTSLLMSEEKYELLFKWAIRNVKKITSAELTKYATLIAISVDIENVSPEEREAFHKVYDNYKKIVAEETEKAKWFEAYRIVAATFNLIGDSRFTTPEDIQKQQDLKEYYDKIYRKLQ